MSLSIDHRLNEGLAARGMSVEVFAKLAAINNIPKASKAKLYESFRGGKALDNETALKLWKLWERVERLCEELAPVRIALDDANHIQTVISLFELGINFGGKRQNNGSTEGTTVPEANPLEGDAPNSNSAVTCGSDGRNTL
ncbi:MAG: hypothetical protein WBL50_16235 [Candidatus Acidiferrum sp.]